MAEVVAYLARDVDGVLLQSGTGSGKTVMGCEVIRRVTEFGWRSLICVHRCELLRQMSGALDALGLPHGLIAPGHEPGGASVHVASVDTLIRRPHLRDWLRGIDLVLADEAHHTVSPTWQTVQGWCINAQRLGLTATPWRLDGKGLGDAGYEAAVKGPPPRQLIAEGYLSPVHVYAPPAPEIDLRGVRTQAGDYVRGQLERAVNTDALTQAALVNYTRWCPGAPAVVFCAGVDHAQHVAAAFSAAGWSAQSVDGSVHQAERDAAISGLAVPYGRRGSVQVLTSCELISEGLDIPSIRAALLLRPSQSTGLYLQQVGRAGRPAPGKTRALVLDMVGNTRQHGMPDADRPWDLRGGFGRERQVSLTYRCVTCHRVSEETTCPECGTRHSRVPARPFEALSDDTIRFARTDDLFPKVRRIEHLQRIQAVRDYNPGWVHHMARELGIRA